MNMTKRDIADIVLLWMGFTFLLALLTSIVTLGAFIALKDGVMEYTTQRSNVISIQLLHVIALFFLNYVLFFRRPLMLSLLFPDASQKEVSIPSSLTALASYSFWIRLLGIFTFLSSGIGFLSSLATNLTAGSEFMRSPYWIHVGGTKLISATLAAIVAWKADWIAKKVEKFSASKMIQ